MAYENLVVPEALHNAGRAGFFGGPRQNIICLRVKTFKPKCGQLSAQEFTPGVHRPNRALMPCFVGKCRCGKTGGERIFVI